MSTVLLIHNDEDVLQDISVMLKAARYCCVTANTGEQGIRQLGEERPDVVITDREICIADGTLLLEAIRRGSSVPILIVTRCADDYTDAVRLLGDVGVLRKPIDPVALARNVGARCSPSWQIRASVNRAGELTDRPGWAA